MILFENACSHLPCGRKTAQKRHLFQNQFGLAHIKEDIQALKEGQSEIKEKLEQFFNEYKHKTADLYSNFYLYFLKVSTRL